MSRQAKSDCEIGVPVSACLRNNLAAYDSYTLAVAWKAEQGKELARLRERLGWTLSDVADASGVERGTINKIELGKTKRPHPSTVRRIRDVLEAELNRRDSRPGQGTGRASAFSSQGSGTGIEDRLGDLLAHIKTLKGKERRDFIRAVIALLTALEHARPAAGSGTPENDDR